MKQDSVSVIERYNRGEIGVLEALDAAREVCAAAAHIRCQSIMGGDQGVVQDWCEPDAALAITNSLNREIPSDWFAAFPSTESWWAETGKALEEVERYTGEVSPFSDLCANLLLAERQRAVARFSIDERGQYTNA